MAVAGANRWSARASHKTEGRSKIMRLYRRVDLADADGVPIQFVGVYVLKWGKVDKPTDGFVEATEEEMAQAAKDNPPVRRES